jgi:lipopolysaccharide transport system permease protein/teichoic acid transport system permease protein
VLPVVKALSALIVHILFIVLLMIFFLIYGYTPSIYWLQFVYYLIASVVLILGLSWLTSSLMVFIKDIGQAITIFLQFGFWLTPVFWPVDMLPPKVLLILKLNPVMYLVNGYRNSFMYNIWFWEHWHYTLYYWVVALSVFVTGAIMFRKLRPHFADVL